MDIESIMLYIWLGIFVLSLVIELCTNDIVSIWFCGGSVVALILSAIPGIPWWVEVIVFIVVSVFTLFLVRPIVKKFFTRDTIKTNTDDYIGKKALVVKDITEFEAGEVKLNGLIWTAISKETISKDSIIIILAIEGNKLIVKKCE